MAKPGSRGPSGVAPPPPVWLGGQTLPIDVFPAGTALHRIYRTGLDPVFFGPGPDAPPTGRFDSATGRFGVLYVGLSLKAALAETLLRNPQRLMVSMSEIRQRSATILTCSRPLRVVRMHGTGLQGLGTDNAISTGPYEPCGLWADALWDHGDRADGIAYQSRHDSGEICLALFERPDVTFRPGASSALSAMLGEVANLLDGYGKSLAPDSGV